MGEGARKTSSSASCCSWLFLSFCFLKSEIVFSSLSFLSYVFKTRLQLYIIYPTWLISDETMRAPLLPKWAWWNTVGPCIYFRFHLTKRETINHYACCIPHIRSFERGRQPVEIISSNMGVKNARTKLLKMYYAVNLLVKFISHTAK